MDSGIPKIYAYRIQNPAFCNPESRSINTKIPENKTFGIQGWNVEFSTWDPEFTSWNMDSKIVMDYLTWGKMFENICLIGITTSSW